MHVVEADIGRRVPDMIIARAIDLQRQYRCVAWGIESVQFQEFLYTELLKRSSAAGIPFPGVALRQHADKDLRIISLQPYIASGQILLHRSQYALIEQLRYYPEADHDDGPDALEMLWRIARQYGGDWGYTPVVPSERYRGKQDDWED